MQSVMVLNLSKEILPFCPRSLPFLSPTARWIFTYLEVKSLKLIGELSSSSVNATILIQVICVVLKTEIDSTNVSENLSVLLMTEYPLGWEVSPLNFLLLAIYRVG